MADSSRSRSKPIVARDKPKFPLWQHAASGQWCKKIKGQLHYFGTDKNAAHKEYARVKEDREAGREPLREDDKDGTTLKQLCNTFLGLKESKVGSGELTQTSLNDYWDSAQALNDFLERRSASTNWGWRTFSVVASISRWEETLPTQLAAK